MKPPGDIGDSRPSDSQRGVPAGVILMCAAAVTGLCAGLCAHVLKFFISRVTVFFTGHFGVAGPDWLLAVIPVAGIILAVTFQRFVLHHDITHGVAILGKDLGLRRYALPAYLLYGPMAASTVTLGMGGSAGAEGPVALTGAAIGSNIGRWLRLSPDTVRILIGCGAAAGIAGIFKAPVGGILFTLEVLHMSMTTVPVLAVVVAGVAGALTASACSGFTPDIGFIIVIRHFDPSWIPWIIALGLFCGIYSIYYSDVIRRMQRWFGSFSDRWSLGLVGGLILGASVFLFPTLYGEGYTVVTGIVNGDFSYIADGSIFHGTSGAPLLLVVAGILAVKCFAVVATNSAGGVAGDFAPTIFAGAMAGFLFAAGVNAVFGVSLPVGVFALLGAAGVFSGAIHAPLMGMFLVAEMAGCFTYFPGFALCAVISYITVKVLRPRSLYEALHHDDLVALFK